MFQVVLLPASIPTLWNIIAIALLARIVLGPHLKLGSSLCLKEHCTALTSVLYLVVLDSGTMAIGFWLQRCTPGVSSLVVIFLLSVSNIRVFAGEAKETIDDTGLGRQRLSFSEGFFIFYTIFLHLVISAIPLRIIRGARLATQKMQEALESSQKESDQPEIPQSRSHQSSPPELIHVSIIPSYKESFETLQDTLKILASHRLAKTTYDVRKYPHTSQKAQRGC